VTTFSASAVYPADKPHPTTAKGLRKEAEWKRIWNEDLEVAFNLNWTVTEPEVVDKVVDDVWKLEETGGEKLRGMILDGRMPLYSDQDRERMVYNTQALMARGDWHMDPCSTHRRRIRTKPSPKCAVPTEAVHSSFKKV
jgi:hypothetical protein